MASRYQYIMARTLPLCIHEGIPLEQLDSRFLNGKQHCFFSNKKTVKNVHILASRIQYMWSFVYHHFLHFIKAKSLLASCWERRKLGVIYVKNHQPTPICSFQYWNSPQESGLFWTLYFHLWEGVSAILLRFSPKRQQNMIHDTPATNPKSLTTFSRTWS